jgi:hypothetical protein
MLLGGKKHKWQGIQKFSQNFVFFFSTQAISSSRLKNSSLNYAIIKQAQLQSALWQHSHLAARH